MNFPGGSSASLALFAIFLHSPCEKYAESIPEFAHPPTPSVTPKATWLEAPISLLKNASWPLAGLPVVIAFSDPAGSKEKAFCCGLKRRFLAENEAPIR